MKKRGWSLWLVLAVIVISVVAVASNGLWRGSGGSKDEASAEGTAFTLGTVVQYKIYGPQAAHVANNLVDELHRITGIVDRFRPESDIGRLNSAQGKSVHVSGETMQVIGEALKWAEVTGGAFDPTIAPLIDLWGFVETEETAGDTGSPAEIGPTPIIGRKPPTEREIREVLPLVNYKKIRVNKNRSEVGLTDPAMAVDLGGIAKGYALDRALEVLLESDIRRGVIDLGGDLYALGTRPDGKPWRIGILDPRQPNKVLGVVSVQDAAVVTSGDYERYFEYEGVRYSHLLDPSSGYPARDVISVTVVAKDPVAADALATAIAIMGPDAGFALLEELKDIEGIVIDKHFNIKVTTGLAFELRE